jgi:hypothetical protein
MDKLAQYREYVQTLLNQYAKDDISNAQVEVQLIFDIDREHYQWMNVGWQHLIRIDHCILHIDIKDGKIWIQQNLTDQDPAEELIKMGVPREEHHSWLTPTLQTPLHGLRRSLNLLISNLHLGKQRIRKPPAEIQNGMNFSEAFVRIIPKTYLQ